MICSLLGPHWDVSRNQAAAHTEEKLNNPQADDEGSVLSVGEIVFGEISLTSPESWYFAESTERTLISEPEYSSHDNGGKVAYKEAGGANTSTDSAEGNSGSAAEAAHIDTDEKEDESIEEKKC